MRVCNWFVRIFGFSLLSTNYFFAEESIQIGRFGGIKHNFRNDNCLHAQTKDRCGLMTKLKAIVVSPILLNVSWRSLDLCVWFAALSRCKSTFSVSVVEAAVMRENKMKGSPAEYENIMYQLKFLRTLRRIIFLIVPICLTIYFFALGAGIFLHALMSF